VERLAVRLSPRQRASWAAHFWKAATQQHHKALRPLFAPYLERDSVVVDIGAHAGQFSKLFARMAPEGHVYAFEPSAYARSVMAPAIAINRLRNITILPVGLSDALAERVLHTPLKRRESLGFGLAHLGEGAAPERAMDQRVRLTTLDAFADEHNLTRLDLVKADIEGWEMRALVGGERCLRRFLPALYLEVDEAYLTRAGDTPADLFAWLAGLGYQAFAAPRVVAVPAYASPGDYLFVAKDAPSRRTPPSPISAI
jgi:FkbM family methyltransferase